MSASNQCTTDSPPISLWGLHICVVAQAGAFSNKDVLKLLRVFERPLETRPGSAYAYVNVNWVIAGYIVEQVRPGCSSSDMQWVVGGCCVAAG
jgi:hypothetical protein